MTHPRGRTAIGSAPCGLFGALCCALTLIGAAGACARPGNTPGGTPTRTTTVTVRVSAVPASPVPMSDLLVPAPSALDGHQIGVARCAQPAIAVPMPAPGAPYPRGSGSNNGPNDAGRGTDDPGERDARERDARERSERALEAQRATFPRRGDVPEAAAAGATECARLLQLEFTLRAAGGRVPDEPAIRAALQSTGLTKAVIEPGPRFATSTGRACIVGNVTAGKVAMVITPLPANRLCRP